MDEFEDYTTASPWEKFVFQLEEQLRFWRVDRGKYPLAFTEECLSHDVTYEQRNYTLYLYFAPSLASEQSCMFLF